MLSWEAGASIRLHQSTRLASIRGGGALHSDISRAFLQDDGEDDAFFHANSRSSGVHSVEDGADVWAGVAGGEHVVLVQVEDGDKVQPGASRGEVGGRSGEELSAGLPNGGKVGRGSGCSSGLLDAGQEAKNNGGKREHFEVGSWNNINKVGSDWNWEVVLELDA